MLDLLYFGKKDTKLYLRRDSKVRFATIVHDNVGLGCVSATYSF